MSNAILRLPSVKAITGLSRSTIYALIARGLFPRQVPLVPGGRSVGWLDVDVTEFIRQRIDERGS
jgi:prophage regulatory protein